MSGVRIIVRGVSSRQPYINYVARRIPSAEWCIDQNRTRDGTNYEHSALRNYCEALRRAGDDAVVHMEEDVLLCGNFEQRLNEEIGKRPDNVIQFFSMRKDDKSVGSRWDKNFIMALCYYLPAGYSKKLLDFHDRWVLGGHEYANDIMVRDWLDSRREPYWICVPNLVQHRIGKSEINSRRSSKRLSLTFVHAPGEEHLT
jgi:hypothetical protein